MDLKDGDALTQRFGGSLLAPPSQDAFVNVPPDPEVQEEVEGQQEEFYEDVEDLGGNPCHAGDGNVGDQVRGL